MAKPRTSTPHIPWARDVATHTYIRAHEAQHLPPLGTYACLDPDCLGDLTVYERPTGSGKLYFRHRHKAASERCGFHPNQARTSRRHDTAQKLLAVVLRDALRKLGPMPLLEFHTSAGARTVLPLLSAEQVVLEWTCPRTRRRADIALLDRLGEAVLLVEIFHTHAVDRNKREDLSNYWWVEVEANAVIRDFERLPIRHGGNMPYVFLPDTQQIALPGMRPKEW